MILQINRTPDEPEVKLKLVQSSSGAISLEATDGNVTKILLTFHPDGDVLPSYNSNVGKFKFDDCGRLIVGR